MLDVGKGFAGSPSLEIIFGDFLAIGGLFEHLETALRFFIVGIGEKIAITLTMASANATTKLMKLS